MMIMITDDINYWRTIGLLFSECANLEGKLQYQLRNLFEVEWVLEAMIRLSPKHQSRLLQVFGYSFKKKEKKKKKIQYDQLVYYY
jgi:hypothetical protein